MYNRAKQASDIHVFVEERLSEFVDGQLGDVDRARVAEHLQTCDRCRSSLNDLKWTISLLKQVPPPPLPRQFTLPVTPRAPVAANAGWMVWGLRGAAVAVVAGLVFLVTVTIRPFATPSPSLTNRELAAQPSVPPTSVAVLPQPTQPLPEQPPSQAQVEEVPTTALLMVTVEPPAEPTLPIAEREEEPPPPQPQPTDSAALAQDSAVAPTPLPPQPTRVRRTDQAAPTPTPETMAAAKAAESGSVETPVVASAAEAASAVGLPGIVRPFALAVRSGPGRQFPIVGSLKQGDSVKVLGRVSWSGWLQIDYPQNVKTGRGWVAASFIQLDVPVSSLPVVSPDDEGPVSVGTPQTATAEPSPTPSETPDSTPSGTPASSDEEPDISATETPAIFVPSETPPVNGTPAAEPTYEPTPQTPSQQTDGN